MTALSPEREAVLAAQDQLLDQSDLEVRPRKVQLEEGPTLQVLEAGEGEPLVLLHGSGTSAVSWLPLMEHLRGRRLIAVDRPGYGLSDPVDYRTTDCRLTAVEVMTGLLDALGLDAADLLGNSTGGFWSLWLALDRPERLRRLVLVGGTPLLPGTRVPTPLKIMTTPGLGELMSKLMTPSPALVIRQMASAGEGKTITNYPRLIDALVAAGSDPVGIKSTLDELRAAVVRGPWGLRREHFFTEEDLGRVHHPTLLVWGDHDPVGDVETARRAAGRFPNAQLEVLPTGHWPWLGEPNRTAQLITDFLARN